MALKANRHEDSYIQHSVISTTRIFRMRDVRKFNTYNQINNFVIDLSKSKYHLNKNLEYKFNKQIV